MAGVGNLCDFIATCSGSASMSNTRTCSSEFDASFVFLVFVGCAHESLPMYAGIEDICGKISATCLSQVQQHGEPHAVDFGVACVKAE